MPPRLTALVLGTLLGCVGGKGERPPEAKDPWARAVNVEMGAAGAVPGTSSAVYLRIRNPGPRADRLLGGKSPVASRVELHESRMEGDVMRMRRVEGLLVPGGGEVGLTPGGLHLMLLDLRESLVPGDTLSLTLDFERAGPVEVRVPVRGVVGR